MNTTESPHSAPIHCIAVGTAGARILAEFNQISTTQFPTAHADTDPDSLRNSPLTRHILLGFSINHGLGAGGDPDIGRLSAESDLPALRDFVAGARIVFVLAGLGGGTGSGAAPVVARIARESGALVLAIATTPLAFERRRLAFAAEAIEQLKAAADAVLTVSNERVRRMHYDKTHPHEIYKFTNSFLVHTLQGLWRLLNAPGLIQLDFSHVQRLLRGRHCESAFATVQASGNDRAHLAANLLLNHPFLDTGTALATAGQVLISIAGGDDLQIGEVEQLIKELETACPEADFIVGASTDPSLTGHLHVTTIAAHSPQSSLNTPLQPPTKIDSRLDTPSSDPKSTDRTPSTDTGEIFNSTEATASTFSNSRLVPTAPELSVEQRHRVLISQKKRITRGKPDSQMIMNLDIAPLGRFDNTEKNRHKGIDLDVPTYLRHGLVLN